MTTRPVVDSRDDGRIGPIRSVMNLVGQASTVVVPGMVMEMTPP
jgi:hypothetical protein